MVENVMDTSRNASIREDTFFKGSIRNGRRLEVHGYLEGEVVTESLFVGRNGRVFGTIRAGNAEIEGMLQGRAIVTGLISIRSNGSVTGNVLYGQLAMEPGGTLSAEVRNVPPSLAGDFHLVVGRGEAVAITSSDLTAYDPDDAAEALSFSVSNLRSGHVVLAGNATSPVERFSLADLLAGKVLFIHDGNDSRNASFEVVVADGKGATSGSSRTVNVSVMAAG